MRDSLVISDMSVNLRPSSPPLVEEIYSISRAMTPFHLGDVASKLPSPMASTLFEKPASMKDRRILAELMSILSNGTVYYAHDVDLTNSHQRSVNYDGAAFRFGQVCRVLQCVIIQDRPTSPLCIPA